MAKKRQKILRRSNQANGLKKRELKRQDSSTSTCTDLNEIFLGVENIKLEENESLSKKDIPSQNLKHLNGKPKGLRNFGNTCYLNSSIQVLCQTPMFYELINKNADPRVDWNATDEEYFKKKLKDKNVNIDDYRISCKLSAPSILHSCLVSLIHSLRSELKSSSDVISPKNFVREIKSSFAQFSDNDQQDSHEFLRYLLLEGIRTSEIKRQYKSILNNFQIECKQNRLSKEDEKFPLVQAYINSSNFTIIDSIFGGYTISSLKCEKCEYNSQIFEPFYELSLPMVDENKYHNNNKKQKIISIEKKKENSIEKRNYLLEKNSKKLTMKERKLKRQLKKAARRESRKTIKNQESYKSSDENVLSENEQKENEKNDNNSFTETTLNEKTCQESNFNDVLNISVNNYNNKNKSKSCGESSDDEASSNDDFNEENSEAKLNDLNEKNVVVEKVQSNNSNDSGINNINSASNLVNNTEISILEKNEEKILKETSSKEKKNSYSDKESDTGFEDKESLINCEADSESEESNSGDVETNDNDLNSDKNSNTMSIASDDEDMSDDEDNCFMENKEDYDKKIKYILSTVSEKTELPISCSLQACFSAFTKTELMVGSNKLYCKNCTKKFRLKNQNKKKVYTNASRQTLIALPPAILFLQLKRFEMNNFRSFSKINQHVHFPLVFDLSPYVSNVYKKIEEIKTDNLINQKKSKIIYSLYGIIEHTGSLRFGHYKAYVRYNNKESQSLKKFLHMTSYIPKINEIMESISIDDLNLQDLNKKENLNNKSSSSDLSETLKEELLIASKERWFLVNDSSVTQIHLKDVLKAQAYLLFYERRC